MVFGWSVVGVVERRIASVVEGTDSFDAIGVHCGAPVGFHHGGDGLFDRLAFAEADGAFDGLHRCG